jgi:hypothetical protein
MLDNDGNDGVFITERKHTRYGFFRQVRWDYFTGNTGMKSGYVLNISRGGCLIKASEAIDHRRWVRIVIQDRHTNVCFSQIGRIIRRENMIECMQVDNGITTEHDITLYRYGVEFTHPSFLTATDEMIAALAHRNLSIRSYLSLGEETG